jgi:hypothetical protein
MTKIARQADDASPVGDELDSFSKRLDLEGIQVTRWVGELLDDPTGDELHTITAELRGEYRFHGTFFQCRWNIDAPVVSGGRSIASLGVTVVETFMVKDGPRPSSATLLAFMKDCALPITMPYIREALQNMSMRLGLGDIVLGLMHDPGLLPHAATGRKYYFHKSSGVQRSISGGRQIPEGD